MVSKSDAADQQKMLNVEAKPFVPDSLKHLFDEPPNTFMSCERPLDVLFNHWCAATRCKTSGQHSNMQVFAQWHAMGIL